MLKPFTAEINVDMMQPAIAGGNGSISDATTARDHVQLFRDLDEMDQKDYKLPKRYSVVVEIAAPR
eukprot:COSAG02_NODE_2471_length_8745_cov_3.235485_3_plen_66_part_00